MVKLGDFGIVKVLEKTAAMAVTKVGTPYYFSPELCRNRPYSYKSDVWAVGVLTYQLMSLWSVCSMLIPSALYKKLSL